MVADADLNGKSVEEVVAAWMAENEATWKSWIAQ
jgi:glycine betaine/proline transport system substrate-binding protein